MNPLDLEVFFADPWWVVVLKALFALVLLLVLTLFTIWYERRVVAFMQHRQGPMMNGPFGLLQSLADGMKLMFKEDFTPTAADKVVFMLAPFVVAIPAITAFAVIPIAGEVRVPFTDITTPLQVTDLPVSVLFIVAIASIGVYGIVLAGWSSGSTYALLGALRSSAQVISYEVAMGLALVAVFLYAGSLSTSEIVDAQAESSTVFGVPLWFAVQLFPSFVIYLISMVGETNRAPFDLPEAEGELVGGFHTEYSSMRFAMFFMAEYMNMITVSALAVDPVPGRLPRAAAVQPDSRRGLRLLGRGLVPAQGPGHAVSLRLAARHAAADALRPVHALRLALADPDLADLDDHDRHPSGGPARGLVPGHGVLGRGGGGLRGAAGGDLLRRPGGARRDHAGTGRVRSVRRRLSGAADGRPGTAGTRYSAERDEDAGHGQRRPRTPREPGEGQQPDGVLRPGRGLRRDLQDDVPQDLHHRLSQRAAPHGSEIPRSAPAQPLARRTGEVRRLRAVRLGLPRRRDLRRRGAEHRGGAVLPRGALRPGLPDQLPALHLVRAVHRGLPDPGADHDQRVRAGRRLPGRADL